MTQGNQQNFKIFLSAKTGNINFAMKIIMQKNLKIVKKIPQILEIEKYWKLQN